MHTRRLICSFLAFWLAWIIIVPFVLSTNLWIVDTTIGSGDAVIAKSMEPIGYQDLRQLLRHTAGEANRVIYHTWGIAQICLALILIAMLVAVKAEYTNFAAGGLALLISVGLHFILAREISGVGKLLDFKDSGDLPALEARLQSMQQIYWALQAVVGLIAAGLLGAFLRRTRSRRLGAPIKPVNQVNPVYDTDDAHVDG